jgi:hypothetical protein
VFRELKGNLEEFLEDRKLPVAKQKVLPFKSSTWKEVLFNSLLVLLSEVTFTHNEALQQILLTKVKKWYDEKTVPPVYLPSIRRRNHDATATKRTSLSETPLKERRISTDLRKLDAFPTIESQSSSPTKSPRLPRFVLSVDSESYRRQSDQEETSEAKLNGTYIDFKERELLEMKASTTRNSED